MFNTLRPFRTRLLRAAAALVPASLGILGLVALPGVAGAQPAVMVEAGNQRLRDDLQWLIDRRVISFSTSSWPVSLSALDTALRGRRKTRLSDADLFALRSVQAELARLRKPMAYGAGVEVNSGSFAPNGFDAQARGRAEGNVYVQGSSGQVAGRLQVNVVGRPISDRQASANLEGSYLAGEFGGQVFYAGQLSHWWGPGQDGSLVWSNAGTAIPGVGVQRGTQRAFRTPWLSWLGPWTYDVFLGRMQHNEQVPGTRVFTMRLSARPLRGLEIGASRFIQWGGEGADAGVGALWDAFLGRANTRGGPINNEIAGFDMRYTFGLGGNPVTLYGQLMGEDEAGLMPAKKFGLLGAQYKHVWRNHRFQWHVEAADTMTSRYFGSDTQGANVAYTHSFYRDGLYHEGLPTAYFAGGDARVYSMGLSLIPQDDPRGIRYTARLLHMDVNPGNQAINQAFPVADRRQAIELATSWMRRSATYRAGLVAQRSRVNGNDVGVKFSVDFPLER